MMVEFTANLNGDDGDGSAVVEGTDSEINARSMWFCRCRIYFSIGISYQLDIYRVITMMEVFQNSVRECS